jgi:hypothetical protein
MLVSQVYKHTFRLCNFYCLSTATVVARTRLNIVVQYMACFVPPYLLIQYLRFTVARNKLKLKK